MQSGNGLREKLLQEELESLQTSLQRIESLGVPLESGIIDAFNKTVQSAQKMITGKKEVDDVYKKMVSQFGNTNVQVMNGEVHVTFNSKQVVVSQVGGKWQITVGGQTFAVKDLNDMVMQIKTRTQDAVSASAQQVMRYSRCILQAKRLL